MSSDSIDDCQKHEVSQMPETVWTTSDLIFPQASQKISHTLLSLKRSRLSIRNRIASILSDANFVLRVAQANNLPLVANERCGSWYISNERKAGSVYFKSTDGHQGQWKFSLRRLNLDILDLLGQNGGCIIVDSTRRGKSMPDALSKTIPIWCAVINYFVFPDCPNGHEVIVPQDVVSESEASQIRARLGTFSAELSKLDIDWSTFGRKRIRKPLRPYFITQESYSLRVSPDVNYTAVICCSASRHERGDNDDYVQGAGDDNENWSRGLTANLFWKNREILTVDSDEAELADRIDSIVANQVRTAGSGQFHEVKMGQARICLCDLDTLRSQPPSKDQLSDLGNERYDLLVTCDMGKEASDFKHIAANTVHLRCSTGKLGSRILRSELPKMATSLVAFIKNEPTNFLFACATGKDLSVAMALVAMVILSSATSKARIDKPFMRNQLAKLTIQVPDANPSRATLQSVNAYLMEDQSKLPKLECSPMVSQC